MRKINLRRLLIFKMGGIIEDRIFEALGGKRLNVRQVRQEVEELKPSYSRTYTVIDRHLRKMYRTRQLNREKHHSGVYVYWNPAMWGN